MVSSALFSDISANSNLIANISFFKLNKELKHNNWFRVVRLSDYFDILSGYAFKSEDYEEDGVPLLRIGDINKDGTIQFEDMNCLPIEFAEKFQRFLVRENDIAIAMTGATIGKSGLCKNISNKLLLNQRVGLLRVKDNAREHNLKFLYYLLKHDLFYKQVFINSMGKSQPNISPFDILKLKIPLVPKVLQERIIYKIFPFEAEITNLKNSKQKPLDIINRVFSEEFNILISEISSIDKIAKINVNLNSISLRNNNLRDSFRWNKIQLIQNYFYKDIDCIQLLGNFIFETKNGWSPPSIEGGDGIPILGQEHFSFDGVLKISPTKFTEEIKNNIEDYYIQKGDFFVSRGNTIDLVALASVVEEEISEDIVFPDLYIKIKFDEILIDKRYLALLFNSFFGRLYFKYVSKGKNQTMVKISSSELYNFYLPIPKIEIQRKIVERIKIQIDAQSIIDKKIEKKIAKINSIIEESIKNK
jgi:type I restriction enzyme S subunit